MSALVELACLIVGQSQVATSILDELTPRPSSEIEVAALRFARLAAPRRQRSPPLLLLFL